jgi:hypothetical protein
MVRESMSHTLDRATIGLPIQLGLRPRDDVQARFMRGRRRLDDARSRMAQSSRLDALPIDSRWIGRRSIDKREDCSVKLLRAVVIVALLLPVTSASASAAVPGFGHVFVIVGENTSYSQVTARHAPFLTRSLRPKGAWLTHYRTFTKSSSLGQYISATSTSSCRMTARTATIHAAATPSVTSTPSSHARSLGSRPRPPSAATA